MPNAALVPKLTGSHLPAIHHVQVNPNAKSKKYRIPCQSMFVSSLRWGRILYYTTADHRECPVAHLSPLTCYQTDTQLALRFTSENRFSFARTPIASANAGRWLVDSPGLIALAVGRPYVDIRPAATTTGDVAASRRGVLRGERIPAGDCRRRPALGGCAAVGPEIA